MNTIEQLQTLIHDKFGVDQSTIDPDAPFASYNLDSLTVAELMFAIEDELHVVVPDEAIPTLTTLRELANVIDGLRVLKAAA